MSDASLQNLADAAGSEPRYWDIQGRVHERSPDAARFLLKALGIPAETDSDIIGSLTMLEEEAWRSAVPPVVIATEGQPIEIPVRVPHTITLTVRWALTSEEGRSATGEIQIEKLDVLDRRDVDGVQVFLFRLILPPQPMGYYRLEIEGHSRRPTRVVVAPARCHLPPESASHRYWGITTQLYSLRSDRNWGIGDLSDLGALARWAARNGADMIGINPLHALFLDDPQLASPYSPNSRLFLNPLYLDVTALPEYVRSKEVQVLLGSPQIQRPLQAARTGDLVDYPAVAAAKIAMLEALYQNLRDGREARQYELFRKYVAARGIALERFAVFQMLSENFQTHDWQSWPLAYRDPANVKVARLARERADRVEFFQYLQWCSAEQRSEVARAARESGMRLGLYSDLAVGAETASADHWANQNLFMRDLRIGAPPDPFNEAGQEWGLVPLSSRQLRASGYGYFSALLQANMRDAGVLRVDHVMGWQRLFLIPAGAPASDGFYLHYPVDEFLAVAALESQRSRCIVIGEDLGTVPSGFRERMAAANVLSSRVFYFEQEHGEFRAPSGFPKLASVSATTHDLATLRGYWELDDISAKARLGIIGPEEEQSARSRRAWDKQALLEALRRESLLPAQIGAGSAEEVSWSPALAEAVHLYLARTPSLLLTVQIEDLAGELRQANLPDSGNHANWRRRLGRSLEQMQADALISQSLAEIAQERGKFAE